mgnify:CR=1 FL=1
MSVTVKQACEDKWEAYKADCSGFVRAVASQLGVSLTGLANNITDQIQAGPWVSLGTGSGGAAAAKAAEGYLVIGAKKATAHGHVVVVVSGTCAQGKYPHAYWGRLGGVGKKDETINWSWNATDRDQVVYGYYPSKTF